MQSNLSTFYVCLFVCLFVWGLILWVEVKIPLEITFGYIVMMVGGLHATRWVRGPFVSLHWKWGLGGTVGCRGYRRRGLMCGAPICDIDPSGVARLFKGRWGEPDPVACGDKPWVWPTGPNGGTWTPSNFFWQWIGGRGVSGGTPWWASPYVIAMIRVSRIFSQRWKLLSLPIKNAANRFSRNIIFLQNHCAVLRKVEESWSRALLWCNAKLFMWCWLKMISYLYAW